ncbi:MAG TPA: NfeD family protein, partial [Terriglobales bacterium]|nr:NfeD family protein [Terriglobales bacterium]
AVLAAVIELHAQTVYLLAVAAGFFVGGLLGVGGARLEYQLIAVAGVLAAGYPLAHGYRARQSRKDLDPADIGLEVEVISASASGLRVRYRGTEWNAHLAGAAAAAGERLRITGIHGNTLQLARLTAAGRNG